MPTTTTPTTTTTTPALLPVECVNAINLTESWRLDHSGSEIRPINGKTNCDTRDMINSGRPWFRFVGQAGNKLLDKCVPMESCGTNVPMWSNATMPSTVGNITPFQVYGAWRQGCARFTLRASVMRCSGGNHDFVYRFDDAYAQCDFGFCGMSS